MCPACIVTGLAVVAGVAASGGTVGLLIGRRRAKGGAGKEVEPASGEESAS